MEMFSIQLGCGSWDQSWQVVWSDVDIPQIAVSGSFGGVKVSTFCWGKF